MCATPCAIQMATATRRSIDRAGIAALSIGVRVRVVYALAVRRNLADHIEDAVEHRRGAARRTADHAADERQEARDRDGR